MKKKTLSSLLLIIIVNITMAQTKIYEQATGDNLEAYKHEDKLIAWQRLSNENSPYVYYRGKICTTIANRKSYRVAHP